MTAAKKFLVTLDVGIGRDIKGKSFSELAQQGQIVSISIPDKQSRGQLSHLLSDTAYVALPDGVVYSKKHDRLYYTNMVLPPVNNGNICSVRPDGSDPQVVVPKGQIYTPKQLCLDDVNDKLYISDREGLRVHRCNLDGSGVEVLVQTGDFNNKSDLQEQTNWCVGIAISHRTGLFYWSQKGSSKSGTGRIFCASIEGSGLREPTLILENLPEPIDLDVDEPTNTLYWTDRGEKPYGNTFNRLELDDTGMRPSSTGKFTPTVGLKHEVIVQNFNEVIGLCRDKDTGRWYTADMGGTIWSFAADGSDKTVVYHDEKCAFTGITLVS